MNIRKGKYKCSNNNCDNSFTWVLQNIIVNDSRNKNFIVNVYYKEKENEAVVNRDTLRFNCPYCGAVHYLKEEDISNSIIYTE